MRIGIVAPEELLPEVLAFTSREFQDTFFYPFPYHSILDIPGLLSGQQNHADAFMFLGETARRFAAESITPAVPWLAVPRSASALLRLLFRASRAGLRMRIVTDWPRQDIFQLAFHEIGIPPSEYTVHLVPHIVYSEEHLLQNAETMASLYRSGAVDFCITIFHRIQKILKDQHIPVYVLQPSFEDIRSGIERLIFSHELYQNQNGQIAVAALQLSIPEDQFPADSAYAVAAARAAAAPPIWQFARDIQAACVERPPAGYLLFAPRALLENATNHYHQIPLLTRVRTLSPLTLSIGFGLGRSAEESKLHAERALSRALSRGGDQAYLIAPGLASPVPLAQSDRLHIKDPIQPIQEQFLPLAKETGISIRVLFLLYRTCRDMGRRRFTSAELSDFIGVTPRTMNRILLKLIDHHLAADVGKQFQSRSGRPSRLIELRLQR